MNHPNNPPEVLTLANLETQYTRLNFLTNVKDRRIQEETEISIQAGKLVGVLRDALLKQYKNPESPETRKSLNALCVRLAFCFYAEDAGIFGKKKMFHDYLDAHRAEDRRAFIDLFRVLDRKPEERYPYLPDDLSAFPYVNGGLFSDESIEIPRLGEEVIDLILNKAENFDWSSISPTIFGAAFESTLNPETRRSGGMHYTSIENIHKVIDPLFLDALKAELKQCKNRPVAGGARTRSLQNFQKKLASLTFFDPACGSGNFLTETYLSLRRLENEVIKEFYTGAAGQMSLDFVDASDLGIQVNISQFYGIEINDFAVSVARTALWIAESQMMKETGDIMRMQPDFLPLKTAAHITEGNALRMDWESVVPKHTLNYIISNPPFVGARLMSAAQKNDVNTIFDGWKNAGNLDYVSCWYKKTVDLITKTQIRAALVSTNSVTQGESAANLWKPLMERGAHIDFAHRTFRWDSDTKNKAHVHCVIVGVSVAPNDAPRVIYSTGMPETAQNINCYLLDAPNVFINSRKKPLRHVPDVVFGNMPNDGKHLSDYSDERKNEIVAQFPESEVMFKRFLGAREFLHNEIRWCLWLDGVSPALIRKTPPIAETVRAVKEIREKSDRKATRKLALRPTLFGEIRQTNSEYIVIPCHSSEMRRYIPLGFYSADFICGNSNLMMPNATLYHFGVLMSNVHMTWVRAVCGRMKSDYRYSINIVYNNFPWPDPTDAQKAKIEKTAQAILDARALYPDSSLADLYDETIMPAALRKAHQDNDRAVTEAYGFSVRDMNESECVAELMKLYQRLAAQS